jgi:hypothetical protein
MQHNSNTARWILVYNGNGTDINIISELKDD